MHRLLQLLVIALSFSGSLLLPVMRLKLCVASKDLYKLSSQCVFCHNNAFSRTVRVCSGLPYLAKDMSIDEAYCMVRQCRLQMPMMKPEPYYGSNNYGNLGVADSAGISTEPLNEISANGQYADNIYPSGPQYPTPPVYPSGVGAYPPNGYPLTYTKPQHVRRRPPAPITVGHPLRPAKPFGIGKRSIRTNSYGLEDWDSERDILIYHVNVTHNFGAGDDYLTTGQDINEIPLLVDLHV